MKILKHLPLSCLIALTGLATAQADLTVQKMDGKNFNLPAAAQKSEATGIYIVQMKGNPAVSYEGDVAGYKATKPGKGKKINPNSAHVKKYAAHLESGHNQASDSVGADKVYSYRYAFNGFAARMTAADAAALKSRSDVLNVWKDEIRQLQTDASPNWIGVTESGEAWSKGRTGEDVVIGIVDGGIWPEHPSFADVNTFKKGNKGPKIPFGPTPAGFSSSGCDFGSAVPGDAAFACNNKLLAARCYNLGFSSAPDPTNLCGGDGIFDGGFEFESARDDGGHGTHTASTAGGNSGVDAGVADPISGIAPRARISAYKVCWTGGCASSDSAAAIDQAVADGVDVINFSIGGSSNSFASPDDIAFLFAADAGVFVATSNGNAGPGAGTVGTPSGVPWITAVGATQDNGVFYNEFVVNAPGSVAGGYTAVEGASPVSLADTGAMTADVELVDNFYSCAAVGNDLTGKIALASRGVCSFTAKYNNAAAAGAIAIVVFNQGTPGRFDPIVMSAPGTTIPGVMISYGDGALLAAESGLNGTLDPDAAVSAANRIAGFSSRGPNNGALDIIKPDVSAPGVAILAGTIENGFMSINGTSMASPHVAGAFALLKQTHPDWSAAEARSALMTTARQNLKKTFGPAAADPFDIGAGEILPSDAYDPGLAYDAGLFDYLAFSCDNNVQLVSDGFCLALEGLGFPTDGSDLNLPSIGIGDLVGAQTITRTVTAVYNNEGNKNFSVSVDAPAGIDVSVSPSSFTLGKDDTMSYEVSFTVTGGATLDEWAFGSLTWTDDDGNYSVYSPIAVKPTAFSAPANVEGAGTDGSLNYDVQFGYTGDFNATMDGLAEGEGQADVVADGGNTLHFFVVPPGTTLARFSLFDSEIGAQNDLDLQIQGPDPTFPFVCFSGTGTSEEQCDLVNPAPGTYAAFVIDFSSDAGPTAYTLWNFNLDGTDAGNTTITAPPSAVLGTSGNIMVDWAGLTAGTRALGIISYDDGVNPLNAQTDVMIDTQ